MIAEPKKVSKLSLSGKILIGLTGGCGIAVTVISYPFVSVALRKHVLPYVPATTKQVNNILSCLSKEGGTTLTGKTFLDIGSGDGRIVIAAAKNGLHSTGVELNPWLVQYSRLSSIRNGVFGQTKFVRKDLWKFPISSYNYITIFGVEQMMLDLEKKLLSEVNPQSVVIACRFPFPNLEPSHTIDSGVDTVWVYKNFKNPS